MTLKIQAARGLKWQTVMIVGRQLQAFIVFTTLARLLEPASFGLVGLVGIYLAFVAIFADQGISSALIQRQDLRSEHLDTAFWFNIGTSILLCLGTIVLAGPVSAMFGEPKLIPLLRWSSLALVINATAAIHSTLFIKAMDFRRPAIRMLIANLAGGAVGIGMAFAGWGVWALIGQQLFFSLGGAIFLWSVSEYRPSLRFSRTHFFELFQVSFSVFFTTILWFLSTKLDQVIVGRFTGTTELGIYVIAGKGPDMAQLVTHQPIADISLPALSQLQNDHEKMRLAIYGGMELNALMSFAVFVGLAAVASDLIPLLFGSKWIEAAGICSFLSIYALLNALQVFFHPALLASGGIGRFVILNVCQVAGVVAACLIGIQFGVVYLVIGLIINGLIMSVPNLLFLRVRIGLNIMKFLKPCLVPFLASVVMLFVVWSIQISVPTHISTLPRVFFKIIGGGAAYLCVMFLLAPKAIKSLVTTIGHAFHRPKTSALA